MSVFTAVRNLDVNLCKTSYALLGCDKTSSLYSLGKGSSLKERLHTFENRFINVFSKPYDCSEFTPESIVSSGEKALVCLYKGKLTDNLDSLCYTMF